jgi:uncharacterized protein (TIGR03437 family)
MSLARSLSWLLGIPLVAQVNVLTYQYDLTRAGANRNETILTPSNVNQNQFGKLFTVGVDGYIYGQPLYVAGLSVAGGIHNVVFVATEHDSVYAFDADSPQLLWQVSFLDPSSGVTTVPESDLNCVQIVPEIGITSTPVIDLSTNTIYVVAMTKENGSYFHRLHALDLATGAEKTGSPVVIQASSPGTGDATGNTDTLIPKNYKQRPGILLWNGTVYLGMSSHCDSGTYHGWLLGYDSRTLQQVAVYNDTPNGVMGSLWSGGAAPAVDSSGNIYIVTGNGTFDAASGGPDLGESYIKLSSSGLKVLDYFTPFNVVSLDDNDLDTGSTGVALLGDEAGSAAHPHLMAGAGKEGRVYLLDRDNLGKWQQGSDSQIPQSIANGTYSEFGNPAYFNQTVYFCGSGDGVRAFPVSNATLGAPTVSQTTYSFPGCVPTISANGTSNGVLWTLDGSPALRAYDASNVTHELYDSTQNGPRDSLGSYVKFTAPTVVNGKVYAGTQDALVVYGLLKPPAQLTITSAAASVSGPAAPGSLISIKGSNLAASSASATLFPLPYNLGGASVTVNNIAAPLLFASEGQINAQVPFAVVPGTANVVVMNGTAVAGAGTLNLQSVAPGLFTISGQAAVANQDGSVNSSTQPAASGSFISAYLTGLGPVDNPVATGAAASSAPLSRVTGSVAATIGSQPAQVLFAGFAPGYAGLYQVNLVVPQLAPGNYPLQISVNGMVSNAAPVTVQ